MDVVVPAYHEAATIADVVAVLRRAPAVDRVLVVSDGSRDATADRARAAGAEVLELHPNRGKGQAMRIALDYVRTDPVMYCDADLVDFRPDHVALLADHAHLGYDMVCGLREYGLLGNPLQAIGPLITGERIVRRWILDAVPEDCWAGYAIETAMNYACSAGGGRTVLVPLRGLRIRGKVQKGGFLQGIGGHYRMFRDIARVEGVLCRSGRCTPRE
jgi:glycosyltransferase involved in cell wall biosynthesis